MLEKLRDLIKLGPPTSVSSEQELEQLLLEATKQLKTPKLRELVRGNVEIDGVVARAAMRLLLNESGRNAKELVNTEPKTLGRLLGYHAELAKDQNKQKQRGDRKLGIATESDTQILEKQLVILKFIQALAYELAYPTFK